MCPQPKPAPQAESRRTRHPQPASLKTRQLRVLAQATTRELAWALPAVAREVHYWRARAAAIPAGAIRQDALSSLARKRGHTDGAALFCILPRARDTNLLRLLVAYEIMWDFLDSVNEHGAARGVVNGHQLHLALIDALEPDRPLSDYYRYHPWSNDGGYLESLVRECRSACRRLPSFAAVQPLLIQEATRAQVLAINHDLDADRRDATLRTWTRQEFPRGHEAMWFELTGAASASLTVHALFALATKPSLAETEITRVHRAYFPWISGATTMLDSYVDQAEDEINGDHSYVAHYPTVEFATRRTAALLSRSMQEANELPDSERHVLIVACMAAMYLSKDSAWSPALRDSTRLLLAHGGSLSRLLLPILRLWRIAYAQRST